uniref:Uncharacterized protein n=1 Tax=Anguilla anguilla TaxID=7936 RepID=A0A0E9WS90_ANGAN
MQFVTGQEFFEARIDYVHIIPPIVKRLLIPREHKGWLFLQRCVCVRVCAVARPTTGFCFPQ